MSETPELNELDPIDAAPQQPEDGQAAADAMPAAESGPMPEASLEAAHANDAVEVMQAEDAEAAAEAELDAEPYTDEQTAELRNVVESLVFASDEPVSAKFIRQLIEDVNRDRVEANRIRATTEGIKRAVAAINRTYADRAFHIIQVAGGFAFATKPKYSAFVGKLAKEKARRKLSATAIESLAIIAYKQPITKSEIEFIRGVNADYIIKTLLEKNLISITGRASTPGRPLLYGTTDEFLKHFGLNEITDLPKPREIEELIGETELEVEKRLLAEQQELEFKDELAQKMDGGQKPKSSGSRPPLRQPTGKTVAPIAAPQPEAATSEGAPVPEEAAQPSNGEPQTTEAAPIEEVQAIEMEAASEQAVEERPLESALTEEPAAEVLSSDHSPETEEIEEFAAGEAAEHQPASGFPIYMPPAVEPEPDIVTEIAEELSEPEIIDEPAAEEPSIGEPAAIDEEAVIHEPVTEEAPAEETIDAEPLPEAAAVEEVYETAAIDEAAEIAPAPEDIAEEEPAASESLVEEQAPIETPAMEEAPAAPETDAAPADDETITGPQTVDETAAEHIETPSAPIEAHEAETHEAADGEAHATEKGWSKWKTKIKTFFKKLFV